MILRLTSEDATSELDSYHFMRISNVTSYSFCSNTYDAWNIETDTTLPDASSSNVYFVIDQCYNEAFAHWVYESAIYLPLFHKLKETYPLLKLVLKTEKGFKHLFCKYFNISNDDIVYQIPKESNVCFFPSPISNFNYKQPSPITHMYIEKLFKLFNECPSVAKDPVDYLIMPRQSKENFIGNERTVPFQALFDYFKYKRTKSHRILNTDMITDLVDQINEVRSAKTIICHDGSALLVNGMFVQNKKIIVVGVVTPGQAVQYPQLHKILEYIYVLNNNTLHYYPTDRSAVRQIMNHRA
jgi:hypothetical protein